MLEVREVREVREVPLSKTQPAPAAPEVAGVGTASGAELPGADSTAAVLERGEPARMGSETGVAESGVGESGAAERGLPERDVANRGAELAERGVAQPGAPVAQRGAAETGAPVAQRGAAEPGASAAVRAGDDSIGVGLQGGTETAVHGASAGDVPSGDAANPNTPLLYVAAREVMVYSRPNFGSRKLGYLRAGARVTRSAQAQGFERCTKGFYRIAPEGYVCASDSARLEGGDAVSELADVRPDRAAPMPYVYARSKQPPPPLYVKLPSQAEQARIEPERAQGGFKLRPALEALPPSMLPPLLAAGHSLPTPFGHAYDRSLVSSGRALADSAFAITRVFEQGKRRFGLTTDLLSVPLDRLEPVVASRFHGVALEERGLPLAFVMQRGAYLYSADSRPTRKLDFREAVFLSGKTQRREGARWLETRDGEWLRDERLVRVDAPTSLPAAARNGQSFIQVSISKQVLLAFQGEKPVYATLVSTGVDGLGDPETTRSTVRGQFLIHTKHVSVTMSSDEAGAEFELKDIPYVQYFKDNYAIHAAFWHDGFGTPRSHGCINLAPLDARWLFHWSEPPVPALWHGAFSLRSGTLIEIVP
ncbi:MAG: L,D-transpeptidase family protein [Mesorhizobium sp.]